MRMAVRGRGEKGEQERLLLVSGGGATILPPPSRASPSLWQFRALGQLALGCLLAFPAQSSSAHCIATLFMTNRQIVVQLNARLAFHWAAASQSTLLTTCWLFLGSP